MHTIAEQVADQIIKQAFLDKWYYWLLVFSIYAVATYFTSRFVTTVTERAKLDALHSKVTDIVSHLETTTQAVKSVEIALSRADWSQKEYITLRRGKLEELLSAAYDAQSMASRYAALEHSKNSRYLEDAPLKKCEVLVSLYFPELDALSDRLQKSQTDYVMKCLAAVNPLVDIENQIKQKSLVIEGLAKVQSPDVIAICQQLAVEIVGHSARREVILNEFNEQVVAWYKPVYSNLVDLADAARDLMTSTITPK